MKNKLLLILNSAFCILNCAAQTNVSGFISANTTWNLAGSPYVVIGNALLSHGYTLTIDPGVVVKFDANKALQIDGELLAIGTQANRIIFTSNQPVQTVGYWAKIHFADASINAAFDANGNYLSGSIMKYCDIMYGGSAGNGEVHVVNSSPYFSNCRVKYSSADGISCSGSSCKVDSSTIANCAGTGLSFYSIQTTSCGLNIQQDSILNNQNGGVYTDYPPGCTSIIYGNFFYGNATYSAIYLSPGFNQGVRILSNSFVNNTASASGAVVFVEGSGTIISGNYFLNNLSNGLGGRIVHSWGNADTIRCNTFIGNQTATSSKGVVYMRGSNTALEKNIFDGNINNTSYGVVVSDFQGSTGTNTVAFTNNVIRNNIGLTGICCKFSPEVYGNPMMIIKNNDFINNNVIYTSYITMTGTTANNFLQFKYNNFSNPGVLYELYNNALNGSEDIYCDSNYWGGVSTQHVDSVIYDYFDDAAKSIVYYSPILTSLAAIDTTCPSLIFTEITNIELDNINSPLFPNPFTTTSTIRFGRQVSGATFLLYNLLGEQVAETSGISGESFQVSRAGLRSGVYVYEVREKEKSIARGKAVIY